jgi:nucleotide-binding universal stress UspA family protein
LMDFKKVLVPINGSEADDEAVKLACRLAKKTKAKIYVTYVIQVDRTLPLDAEVQQEIEKGENVLDRAERIAEEQDYEVKTDLLQAREIGPAVVDEAIERGADLIIVGLSYKKKFGEFSLGSVVPYVFRNAPSWVVVCREPIPAEEA